MQGNPMGGNVRPQGAGGVPPGNMGNLFGDDPLKGGPPKK